MMRVRQVQLAALQEPSGPAEATGGGGAKESYADLKQLIETEERERDLPTMPDTFVGTPTTWAWAWRARARAATREAAARKEGAMELVRVVMGRSRTSRGRASGEEMLLVFAARLGSAAKRCLRPMLVFPQDKPRIK